MDVLQLNSETEIAHIGPSLNEGRLPAVFYFALSAQESLTLDPYNQPALYLAQKGVRVFTMNLPSHGPNLNAMNALELWAEKFEEGQDCLSPFIDQAAFAINQLLDRGLIIKEKIGFMGLSRGGLIACLLATKFPEARYIVSFAPLTKLSSAKEFESIKNKRLVTALDLENHIDSLCTLRLRFYMGNRDTRVGTDLCFDLLKNLTEEAFNKGNRSPPIEMIISPSMGHMGHGTSKETFEAGAHFLGEKLGAIR